MTQPTNSGDIQPRAQPSSTEGNTGFYEPYAEYAKTLRHWLAGYGIGGLLFLSNEKILEKLKADGDADTVAVCFILGVVCQVILAFINKLSMWAVYYGEDRLEFQKTWRHEVAEWVSEAFWIDMVLDCLSLFLFGWATFVALGSLR